MRVHATYQCKHGVVVSQCRCPHPKTVVTVLCPVTCQARSDSAEQRSR